MRVLVYFVWSRDQYIHSPANSFVTCMIFSDFAEKAYMDPSLVSLKLSDPRGKTRVV